LNRLRRAALVLTAGTVFATGMVLFIAGCGGGNQPPFNATPAITGLFPSNITAGSQGFTLFVAGTGFVSGSKGVSFAYWNGSPRSTTFNDSTSQLEVTISASDVANPGIAQVTIVNPTPGGGTSAAVSFTVEPVQNGAPVISSFSPTSVTSGGQAFTLTVNGSNFAAGDVVTWSGSERPTTFNSQSEVTASISQDDIAVPISASVSVSTPGLVVASQSIAFPVTGPNNPMPSLSSIAPDSAAAGTSDLQVTIKGSGFVATSTAESDSVPLATAFVSSSQLVAIIPASDLASAATLNITVTNPTPGGGTSGQKTFTVSGS
jgi:hypothetical protein